MHTLHSGFHSEAGSEGICEAPGSPDPRTVSSAQEGTDRAQRGCSGHGHSHSLQKGLCGQRQSKGKGRGLWTNPEDTWVQLWPSSFKEGQVRWGRAQSSASAQGQRALVERWTGCEKCLQVAGPEQDRGTGGRVDSGRGN